MKILVIGATGLIGRFVVDALTPLGEVVGISRTTPIKVDVKDPASIQAMYKSVGKFDHLASCIGKVTFKSILDISYDEYLASVKDKAIGQVELVRAGIEYINDGGSFTLMTGILARNPIPAGTAASLANGAVESFTKAASIELPRNIRINTVSPSVLVEATNYHSAFPGFHQVTGKEVAEAYVKAISGKMTGEVFKLD